MTWTLLGQALKPGGSAGGWLSIPLPGGSGLSSYGFRLEGVGLPPATWQVGGYWGVLYTCDSLLCSTMTHPFLLYPVTPEQPLRVLGADEVSFAEGVITSFDLIVSVNSWVPYSAVSLFGLFL